MAVTTAKLSKWGNSVGIRLNNAILEALNADADDSIDITIDEEKHTVTLKRHITVPRTLAELLDGWDGGNTDNGETTATHSVVEEIETGGELG